MSTPVFFTAPAEFREWLDEHHATEPELLVGFWKVGSGRPSMTWSESVDMALCFGWIDGVRRRLDADTYTIRFTPRRPGSIWSAVNIAKVETLVENGQMTASGIAAFNARRADRTAVYSYEQDRQLLTSHETQALHAGGAWEFFDAQPPSYQRAVVQWLHAAKAEQTRSRRLELLVAESAAGRRVAQFDRR